MKRNGLVFGMGIGHNSGSSFSPTDLDNIISYTDFTDQDEYSFSSGVVVDTVNTKEGSITSWTVGGSTGVEYDSAAFDGKGGMKLTTIEDWLYYGQNFTPDATQTIAFVCNIPVYDASNYGSDDIGIMVSLGSTGFSRDEAHLYHTDRGLYNWGQDDDSGNGFFERVGNLADDNLKIVVIRFNSATSADFFFDDFTQVVNLDPNNQFFDTGEVNRLRFGDRAPSTDNGAKDMVVAECIHLDDAIADNEVKNLINYWRNKYAKSRLFSPVTTIVEDVDTDGQFTIDINGNGKQDIIRASVFGSDGGRVYWYEQGDSVTDWTEHLISSTVADKPEDVIGYDFDDDGKIEILTCEFQSGGVFILKQDGSDPTGTWTDVELDADDKYLQNFVIADVNGDGRMDVIYGHEGSQTGEGGWKWLEYLGGDPTDASNWTQHTMLAREGAAIVAEAGLVDLNGNSSTNQLVVSSRDFHNANAEPAVMGYLTAPANPENTWTFTQIDTTDEIFGSVNMGTFGGTTGIDIVATKNEENDGSVEGLVIYTNDGSASFTKTVLSTLYQYYTAMAIPNPNDASHDYIYAFNRDRDRHELWEYDSGQSQYVVRDVIYPEQSGSTVKVADRVQYIDLDGSGTKRLVIPGGNQPSGTDNGELSILGLNI